LKIEFKLINFEVPKISNKGAGYFPGQTSAGYSQQKLTKKPTLPEGKKNFFCFFPVESSGPALIAQTFL